MQKYRFTLEVAVDDAARCYAAARERIIEDGREWGATIGDEEIERQIGTPEDPNIAACVETLFEPPTDSPPGTRHQWIPEDPGLARRPGGFDPDPFHHPETPAALQRSLRLEVCDRRGMR